MLTARRTPKRSIAERVQQKLYLLDAEHDRRRGCKVVAVVQAKGAPVMKNPCFQRVGFGGRVSMCGVGGCFACDVINGRSLRKDRNFRSSSVAKFVTGDVLRYGQKMCYVTKFMTGDVRSL